MHIHTGSCIDHEGSEYSRDEVYYRQSFTTSGPAMDSAADVVVVVDESGSIYMETLWIREVIFNHCCTTVHVHRPEAIMLKNFPNILFRNSL